MLDLLFVWFVGLFPQGSYMDRFFMNLAYGEEAFTRNYGNPDAPARKLPFMSWLWLVWESDLIASHYYFGKMHDWAREELAGLFFKGWLGLLGFDKAKGCFEEMLHAYEDNEKVVQKTDDGMGGTFVCLDEVIRLNGWAVNMTDTDCNKLMAALDDGPKIENNGSSALMQAISINELYGNENTPQWALDLLRNNGLLDTPK